MDRGAKNPISEGMYLTGITSGCHKSPSICLFTNLLYHLLATYILLLSKLTK